MSLVLLFFCVVVRDVLFGGVGYVVFVAVVGLACRRHNVLFTARGDNSGSKIIFK